MHLVLQVFTYIYVASSYLLSKIFELVPTECLRSYQRLSNTRNIGLDLGMRATVYCLFGNADNYFYSILHLSVAKLMISSPSILYDPVVLSTKKL